LTHKSSKEAEAQINENNEFKPKRIEKI